LLWKRIPTIRHPATVHSMLPWQRAQRSLAQQMGRLQLSGVMSQYVNLSTYRSVVTHLKSNFTAGEKSTGFKIILTKDTKIYY
jgi:hypothetical protein